jgi:predicted DCC family thiol-disulfide oxidoreductase YuxK
LIVIAEDDMINLAIDKPEIDEILKHIKINNEIKNISDIKSILFFGWSELGQEILNHIGVDIKKINSIVLYEPGIAYYIKSEAAFKIAYELNGLFKFLSFFSMLPKSITNLFYDYIAKNRYKWFGKKESCMLPTSELKSKFLS